MVLIRKPNGQIRFCIDFRKLNSKTKRDAYALPQINEMFDSLHGARWFSSLDIKSAYWQVEVEEADKEKTAFTVGHLGFTSVTECPLACQMPQRLFSASWRIVSVIWICNPVWFILTILLYHPVRLEAGLQSATCFRKSWNTSAILSSLKASPLIPRKLSVLWNGQFPRTPRVSWDS